MLSTGKVNPLFARQALTVEDCMTRDPVVVEEGASLAEAVELMERFGVRSLPVVSENGTLAGMLADRRLNDALPSSLGGSAFLDRQRALAGTRVIDVAQRSPAVIAPDAPILRAIACMRRMGTGSLPVVADGRLVGILSAGDLIYLLERVLMVEPMVRSHRPVA